MPVDLINAITDAIKSGQCITLSPLKEEGIRLTLRKETNGVVYGFEYEIPEWGLSISKGELAYAIKMASEKLEGKLGPSMPVDLTDTSPMPFGKHKGCPMQDVPASYLFWLWTAQGMEHNHLDPVAGYIRKNLESLKQEYTDGIW